MVSEKHKYFLINKIFKSLTKNVYNTNYFSEMVN